MKPTGVGTRHADLFAHVNAHKVPFAEGDLNHLEDEMTEPVIVSQPFLVTSVLM